MHMSLNTSAAHVCSHLAGASGRLGRSAAWPTLITVLQHQLAPMQRMAAALLLLLAALLQKMPGP